MGTIIGAVVIAVATMSVGDQASAISYAFSIASIGILASILGVFFVRVREGGDPQLAIFA